MDTPIRRFASSVLLLLVACGDVAPTNQSPAIADTIPNHTLTIRTDSTVDISGYFTDPDGNTLSYGAVSRDAAIVQVLVDGSLLTMTSGEEPGVTEIEVTAFDPDSAQAAQMFQAVVLGTSWREDFDSAGSLNDWILFMPDGASIGVDEEDSVLRVQAPTDDYGDAYAKRDDIVKIGRNWTASTRMRLEYGHEMCSMFAVPTGSADYPRWLFLIDHWDESWWVYVYNSAETFWETIAEDYFDDPPHEGDYINITMSLVNDTMTLIANDSTTLASFDPHEQEGWPDEDDPPPPGATGIWLGAGNCYSNGATIFDWVEIGEAR